MEALLACRDVGLRQAFSLQCNVKTYLSFIIWLVKYVEHRPAIPCHDNAQTSLILNIWLEEIQPFHLFVYLLSYICHITLSYSLSANRKEDNADNYSVLTL